MIVFLMLSVMCRTTDLVIKWDLVTKCFILSFKSHCGVFVVVRDLMIPSDILLFQGGLDLWLDCIVQVSPGVCPLPLLAIFGIVLILTP